MTKSASGNSPTVCIIGAGFGGITVAIQLQRLLKWTNFTIFEKNSDIGGAWLANTYVGSECDYPSHYYSWSFEPNPNWEKRYASQPEILAYIQKVATKYNVHRNLLTNTTVESVVWDEDKKKWNVTITTPESSPRVEAREFDFVFCATSVLWQPKKPKEFEAFSGQRMHTAEWDGEVDFDGKVVGVVGTGSSGVQVVPALVDRVKELHSFQRHPAWILPKDNPPYSPFTKWVFRHLPFAMKLHRRAMFRNFEKLFEGGILNSTLSIQLSEFAKKMIEEQTAGNPSLTSQLIPKDSFGCRVVSLSSTYFPSLCCPNVKVHRSKIVDVTPDSIVMENGTEIKLDILILATGFETQEYFGPMKIIGVNKVDILKLWKAERPKSYSAICSSLAPNLFLIGGPHGLLPVSPAIFTYECQLQYICQLLAELAKTKKRKFVVKVAAENEFMEEVDSATAKHVIGNDPTCESWLKNSRGVTTTVYLTPGSAYAQKMKRVDFTKFDIN